MSQIFKLWTAFQKNPLLTEGEIHVWSITTSNVSSIDNLWNFLNSAEQTKANQFKFPQLRNRFVISQGNLRFLLGKYLNLDPKAISFTLNQYGKPYLKDYPFLKFNLSHAHEVILFAFALKHEIGIDIELIHKDFLVTEISQRFFHRDEITVLSTLPRKQQIATFFNYWVKKEAFIKALGLGLFCGLDKFKVDAALEQALMWQDDLGRQSLWSIQELAVMAGYQAAVANAGAKLMVRFFDV